jgi:putative iron-regulated protein
MKTRLLKVSSILLVGIAVAIGCSKEEETPVPVVASGGTTTAADPYASAKTAIKENYANIVYANYKDSYDKAVQLKTALVSFTNAPSASNLATAKQSWLDAREPYGQTEAFRFSSGPIDDANGPEGQLNAWPLDESYIDYTSSSSTSGIINDAATYPTITGSLLDGLNEQGGEVNISIGYHAIEFLLWGQDDANTSLQTPGNRPFTDFVVGSGPGNEQRRKDYLLAVADLLLDHLDLMVKAWETGNSNNYRASFIALPNNTMLQYVLTGIGTLSKAELAGERMFVALTNQDQEDEHSCFSDNTDRDIILNAQGIRNVYLGSYTRVDGSVVSGTSIKDLIGQINTTIEGEMNVLSLATITNTNAMPVPFDNALTQEAVGGSGPIMTAILSLQNQGDKISEMANAFGLTISIE